MDADKAFQMQVNDILLHQLVNQEPLTHFNRKYGKNVFNFPLPVTTCHHATQNCRSFCYVKRIWHNVLPRYEENYLDSMKVAFVLAVNKQIYNREIRWIRLHTIGDFYSQEYFDKWVSIANANPECKILAYTRNWELNISQKPANLTLFYSVDESTTNFHPDIPRIALAFQPPPDRMEYQHLEMIEQDYKVCSNRCENCRACWSGKFNICFPITNNGQKTFRSHEDAKIHPYNLSGQIRKPKEVWNKYRKPKVIK